MAAGEVRRGGGRAGEAGLLEAGEVGGRGSPRVARRSGMTATGRNTPGGGGRSTARRRTGRGSRFTGSWRGEGRGGNPGVARRFSTTVTGRSTPDGGGRSTARRRTGRGAGLPEAGEARGGSRHRVELVS